MLDCALLDCAELSGGRYPQAVMQSRSPSKMAARTGCLLCAGQNQPRHCCCSVVSPIRSRNFPRDCCFAGRSILAKRVLVNAPALAGRRKIYSLPERCFLLSCSSCQPPAALLASCLSLHRCVGQSSCAIIASNRKIMAQNQKTG